MVRRVLFWLVLSAPLILIAGCTTRLAYNHFDTWLNYRISDYVNLTRQQERVLDNGVERAIETHRQQELPRIHRVVDRLQADLLFPVTYDQMRDYYFIFTELGQNTAAVLAKPLAATLSLLNDSQVLELTHNIQQRFTEIDRKRNALTLAEQRARRANQLTDFTQDWVGSLTDKQEALLEELAGYQVGMVPIFIAIRQQFFREWQQMMVQRSRPEFSAQFTRLMRQMVGLESPNYQSDINFYLNRRFELMRRLNHTLSDVQRAHLNRKLINIRKDVAVLINQ
ncbi:DUF6279 family lipoprotein [Photobacterium nomapromontoriensis]|uniref:DUF6279 family lipoprotein n=1 Tax=Photobacterium nomapromontoriensis TaxID=2910237 RepID=UPI003D139D56